MSAAYGLGRLSVAIDHCSFDSLPLSYSSTSSSLSYSLQLTLSDPKDLNLRIHEILHDNAAVFNSPSPSSSSSLRSPTESLSMPIKLSCSSSTCTLRAKPDWLMVISVIISFRNQAFEMKGEQSMIIGSTLFLETNPFYATEPQEPRQRRIPLFQHTSASVCGELLLSVKHSPNPNAFRYLLSISDQASDSNASFFAFLEDLRSGILTCGLHREYCAMEREILLEALSNLKEDSGNLINQLTELMHSSHIAHDNETEEVRPSLEVFQAVALSKVYLQKLFTETRMVPDISTALLAHQSELYADGSEANFYLESFVTLLKAQALWFLQQALVALQLFTAFEDLELKEFMALRTSFSEYDPDLCNEMLATDLTLLLQDLGASYTEEELSLILKGLDRDRSGFIGFADFVYWWCSKLS